MAPDAPYNAFAADLQANLPTLRSLGKFSDFTITCDGATYKVHKFLLSTHSSYFATIFNSGFKVRTRKKEHRVQQLIHSRRPKKTQ